MIDFGKVKEMSIPEGVVARIICGEVLLWKKPSAGARFGGYTGTYTESSAEIDGAPFTLYTLTTSGTLTIEGDGARFWMCGGGAGGKAGKKSSGTVQSGNGGGGGHALDGKINGGVYAVVIGAGGASDTDGGVTKIGDDYVMNGGETNGNGGSGGGGGGTGNIYGNFISPDTAGLGDEIPTVPFGIPALYCHCAGGGGGSVAVNASESLYYNGGAGGSNGSSGEQSGSASSSNNHYGGTGGERGGGAGGRQLVNSAYSYDGSDAIFYGSGGGGGGAYGTYSNSSMKSGAGGAGYQGVVYIAVPA